MKAKTVCFASAKGGSGKTITAASVSLFLANLGFKVLLVDADASTNGASLFYLDKVVSCKEDIKSRTRKKPTGVFEWYNGSRIDMCQVMNNFTFIPAAYSLRQTEHFSVDSFEAAFIDIIKNFSEKFDFIMVDAQAGSDEFARVAIKHSERTVIVSEYDPISAEGVIRLKRLFVEELRDESTYILLNKVLPEFATSVGDYLGLFKFLPPIPWDKDVITCFASRKSCIDMETPNAYTLAILRLVDSLFGDAVIEKTKDWKQKNELSLTAPIRSEIDTIEQEITYIEDRINALRYSSEYIFGLITIIITILAGVLTVVKGTMSDIIYRLGIDINMADMLYNSILASMGLVVVVFYFFVRTRKARNQADADRLARLLDELVRKKERLLVSIESGLENLVRAQR